MAAKPEKNVLVLQGGGALGAYQAGAYEALHNAGIKPEWIAGISIGAINSAIIAGNPPEKRVEKLRAFWEMVSTGPSSLPLQQEPLLRHWFNEASSAFNTTFGVNGFYTPRLANPLSYFTNNTAQISFYDTTPLLNSLETLVDFDLINSGPVRLSVGAVNVNTGNFTYFDRETHRIGPKHIAASGALPPGFPPVEVDGAYYWDGGLVSNTPLQWVSEQRDPNEDMCVFQVDLFSARGDFPKTIMDVIAREKEIRFSSRTRMNTDVAAREQKFKKALKAVLSKLPLELRESDEAKLLASADEEGGVTVVQLIYKRQPFETANMDNEFSRLTMENHWRAGFDDVMATLNDPNWIRRSIPDYGFVSIDRRNPPKQKRSQP